MKHGAGKDPERGLKRERVSTRKARIVTAMHDLRPGSFAELKRTAAQLAAGERLRADFTRAQMMPRVTANWDPAGSRPGRRSGTAGGMAEMTEAVIAAKARVDKALKAVGPELSGVLIDVCCFLKGISEVEREQGWPARSAKLVLQLALTRLARHYGIAAEARGRSRVRMRAWGGDDFRPVA